MFKKIIFENQETNYSVSDEGQVRNDKTNKIMKGTYARNEYHSVQLSINGKVKTFMVHRLVAEYFVPNENPELNTIVDHIDQDKHNNKASNLRWVTTKANALNIDRQQRDVKRTKADLSKNWKVLKNSPNYSVNDEGELKNNTNNYIVKGTLRNGYLRWNSLSIHRLVWEAFNGPISENMVIDHIDGNRSNNRLENLRLVSQSDNMYNAQRNGHKGQIPISQYDLQGNFIAKYDSIQQAVDAVGGNHGAINQAAKRMGSSAGFLWIKDDQDITIEDVLANYQDKKIKSSYVGVSQYDEQGNFIQHYDSTAQAAKAVSASDSTINRAALGFRLGKGYYWILDNQNINISDIIK